jgi:hypothetical protein
MRLTRLIPTFAVVVASVVAGCSKSDKADATLEADSALVAQQQQAHVDSISALEANNAATPVSEPREPEARRHRSSNVSSSSGTTTTTTTSTSSGDVVVKHTQRDAAIGAVAGGLLGATTSRNKVQGGVIGAVVGGVLGGVVGNNVDKTKKPPTE